MSKVEIPEPGIGWMSAEELSEEDAARPMVMRVAQLEDIEVVVRRAMAAHMKQMERLNSQIVILRLAVEALTHQVNARNSNALAVEISESLKALLDRPTDAT